MTTLTPTPKQQFVDANGVPLSGGKVYTYAAGTTTPLVTYTDSTGSTPNTNPVILDSRGEAAIWLGVASYKLKLTTAADVEIWTVDNIVSASVQALADLSESSGSSLVGFLQAGTGAVATTVQARLRQTVSVKDFGAVGDGVVDDTNALAVAFAMAGRSVFIPAGTYLVTSTLTPACAEIFGEGELASIIKPSAAVTKVMSIGASGYPQKLSSFQIDGTSTTNATGIFFGDTGSCGCLVDAVRVINFSGVNAIGIRIGDMLKSQFNKVTAGNCTVGLKTQYVTATFPTTIQFNSCVFTDCSVNGAQIVDGWNLTFINCDFESSGQEGVKVLPASAGVANNIVFQSCWFEDNYSGNTAQYQFVAGDGTSLGGANINPILRDCFFSTSGATAKAIRMNGVAVDFVIDNPQLISAITGAISIENNAYGVISNWTRSSGMTYNTVVTDANNKAANPDYGNFRTWTPTFTDGASTGFTGTPTLATNVYKLNGSAIEVAIDWTATLAGSGTPQWVRCTVPTNLTPVVNCTTLGWLNINGTWQAGMIAAVNDGFIYFRKIDNSNFPAGAAITFRGVITFNI